MRRTAPLALAAAAALVGCPLPQPLPEYSPVANTPPRIVVDDGVPDNQIKFYGTVVAVPAGCVSKPDYRLDAQIRDSNTLENIEARWFVNYDPQNPARLAEEKKGVYGPLPADPTLRDIDPFVFSPYFYAGDKITPGPADAAGAVHVVELVVSNNFRLESGQPWTPGDPLPNRSPAPGFEVQVYRWVFLNVQPPASGSCGAGDSLCAVCP